MKRTLIAVVLLLLSLVAWGQNPTQPQPSETPTLALPLLNPPQRVPSALITPVGPQVPFSTQQLCYWIVSKYTIGNSSPAGPYCYVMPPASLNGTSYLAIQWQSATGASSYDVLRTTTPQPPTGACNCAVATSVTGNTANDQSNTLSAYTVSNFDPNSVKVQLSNEAIAAGASQLTLRQNGVSLGPFVTPSGSYTWTGAQTFKTANQIRFADQFPGADIGAKINAAVADFGTAPNCGWVVIPSGYYQYSTTITITDRYGCKLTGAGRVGPAQQTGAGTYLQWNGAANGTMMSVSGAYGDDIGGFTLDGNGTAGVGMNFQGDGVMPAFDDTLHDVNIQQVTGTPGRGLVVGDAAGHGLGNSSLRDFYIFNTTTGYYQQGNNTINFNLDNVSVDTFATAGFDVEAGNFSCRVCSVGNYGAAATAGYLVNNAVTDFTLIKGYDEHSQNVPSIAETGTSATKGTIYTIVGSAFSTSFNGLQIFNVSANGALNLIGNSFSGTSATVAYAPVGGSGNVGVLNGSGNQCSGTTFAISGSAVAAFSFDQPTAVCLGGTVAPIGNGLNPIGVSAIRLSNLQLIKSPLTLTDGTSSWSFYTNNVFRIADNNQHEVGGFDAGNFGTANNNHFFSFSRYYANQGTAFSGADPAITLSAGWGTTAAVSAAIGYDQATSFTITANGTGIAANPTATITFKNGTWVTAAPSCIAQMDSTSTGTQTLLSTTSSLTTLAVKFNGTPGAGSTYVINTVCMGR